jgi:hypothetical protein
METRFAVLKVEAMNSQAFNDRILAGEKLVLLDDMVLDVKDWTTSHPGGNFLIQ